MGWFIVHSTLLLGLCLAMLMPALRGRRSLNTTANAPHNIGIAQQRLAELGSVDQASAAAEREVELALLDDLDDLDGANQPNAKRNDYSQTLPKNHGALANVVIILLIVGSSFGIYFKLGSPHALTPPYASANYITPAATSKLAVLLQQLEDKLAAEPNDAKGWALAGKTYMQLEQFTKAESAYQTLNALRSDDAEVLSNWANATVMVNNGVYTAPAVALLAQALALNPQHKNALWSAALGTAANGDSAQALIYLQRLLALLENNSPVHREVTQFIQRLQNQNSQN